MANEKWSAFGSVTPALGDQYVGLQSGSNVRSPISGIVLLAAASVTNQLFVDIALPSGYVFFKLFIQELTFNVPENLTYALSPDGGATFYNDPGTFLDYGQGAYATVGTAHTGEGSLTFDSLGYIISYPGSEDTLDGFTSYGVEAESKIFPGSASMRASIRSSASHIFFPDPTQFQLEDTRSSLAAAVGRQNLIRLQPYGNGDTPPSSTNAIATMTYRLYGHV